MKVKSQIEFENIGSTPVNLIIEPWAEEFKIRPGVKVQIVSDDIFGDLIEMDYCDNSLIIHGWGEGIVVVMIDGIEQEPFQD